MCDSRIHGGRVHDQAGSSEEKSNISPLFFFHTIAYSKSREEIELEERFTVKPLSKFRGSRKVKRKARSKVRTGEVPATPIKLTEVGRESGIRV